MEKGCTAKSRKKAVEKQAIKVKKVLKRNKGDSLNDDNNSNIVSPDFGGNIKKHSLIKKKNKEL